MTNQKGPTTNITQSCDGCMHLVKDYYVAQGDSGFSRTCTYNNEKRPLGYSGRTPDWCPYVVHLIEYASQPDIQFLCDGLWDTPAWTQVPGRPYLAEKGRWYTFEPREVTCVDCLTKGVRNDSHR